MAGNPVPRPTFVLSSLVPVIDIAFSFHAAFAPDESGDDVHGAPRATTRMEKVLGTIGLVVATGDLLPLVRDGFLFESSVGVG